MTMDPAAEVAAAQLVQLRRTVGQMEVALAAIGEAIVWTDEASRIEWCNAAFDTMVEGRHADLLGRSLPEVLPLRRDGFDVPADAHPVHRALNGEPWGRGAYQIDRPRAPRHVEITWTTVALADGQKSAVLALRDVTLAQYNTRELARRTAAVSLLQVATAAANESSSVQEALQRCLDAVCAHCSWPIGHAYCRDETGALRSTGIWHLDPSLSAGSFRAATEQLRFAGGEGLAGRVLSERRALWITDVAADPDLPWATAARDAGLHAAFAFPVRVGEDVEAVLEFFTVEVMVPDPRLLSIMEHVGTQLGRGLERDAAARALRAAQEELELRVEERTRDWSDALDAIQVEVLERERTHKALQESEERYRQLIAAAGDVIVTLDTTGMITSVNASFEATFGWHADAWINRAVLDLVAESGRDIARTLLGRLARGETPPNFELSLLAARGEITGEFSARPLSSDGRIVGTLLVCRDVSARAELARAKDDLVSTVSHELRTPLASLLGFSELLLSRDYPSGKQQEFLRIIQKESQRLTELIDDLLDLQQMEGGRLRYQMVPTDLAPLLEECLRIFEATSHRHTLAADLAPGLPIVRGDGDRLRQAVNNLLSNAIKYSPDGGRVCLSARPDGDGVLVTVEDEGIGIPHDALPKVFERFFRVDNREVRRIGGTGLGLALVKEIVEAHGGTVRVASTVGAGTTFAFTLPAAPYAGD